MKRETSLPGSEDGFRASLADGEHAVLAWPWDHLATMIAWRAVQQEGASRRSVGTLGGEMLAAYEREPGRPVSSMALEG